MSTLSDLDENWQSDKSPKIYLSSVIVQTSIFFLFYFFRCLSGGHRRIFRREIENVDKKCLTLSKLNQKSQFKHSCFGSSVGNQKI
jgi:hypothetical protein